MPRRTHKVIISCALTGGIHTPTMSPALPVSPDMLAEQGVAAAQAGAAILHVHARDPRDGRPTPDPAAYMAFLPRLKEGCEAILNITTGGGLNMTVDDRLKAPVMLRPEMCSLNMGSMNFAIYPLADRYQSWKHDWEEPYLRSTEDFVFKNTFRDIARIVSSARTRARMPLRARMLRRRSPLQPGTRGGSQTGRAAVLHPDDLWRAGRHRTGHRQFDVHETNGGPSVRVGLHVVGPRSGTPSDAVCRTIRVARRIRARRAGGFAVHRSGTFAGSNAEQVVKVRSIVETLGHEIATPADVRSCSG